jgi:hypothetical protein
LFHAAGSEVSAHIVMRKIPSQLGLAACIFERSPATIDAYNAVVGFNAFDLSHLA